MIEKQNGEGNIDNIRLQELLDIIFEETPIPVEKTDHTPEYPESLLQQTQKANKYYNSFQGLTRQFVDEGNVQPDVVRWSNSVIQVTLKSIVENWQTVDVQGTAESTENENGDEYRTLGQSTANTLFSWSSGDSYIESRKRELQFRNSQPNNTATKNGSVHRKKDNSETNKETDTNSDNLKKKLHLEIPKESITNKLNRIVDRESNKFIHKRIQLIKAHHSEQISKEIHERKRKDHERHLNKLKEKEEEYERALQAATSEQGKQNGFFGSLFGFNVGSNNNSHNIDLPPEIDNPFPSRNMTSSPSGKNKRFSFLPTAGLSLWGNNTSVSKKIEKVAATKKDAKNPVSNIHGTYSSDKQGEIEASSSPEIEDEVNMNNDQIVTQEGAKQSMEVKKEVAKEEATKGTENSRERDDCSEERTKYNLKIMGEEIQQNKETASHKSKDSYEKEEEDDDDDDDEFEEYNSSLPNFSMVQEPIQPIVTGIKKSTQSPSHTGIDNGNLLEL